MENNNYNKDIEFIVENFDDMYLNIILYQQPTTRPLIEKIDCLVEKKRYVVIGHLFYTPPLKKLLNNLLEKYELDYIDKIFYEMIHENTSMGTRTSLIERGNFQAYYKNLNAKQKKNELLERVRIVS